MFPLKARLAGFYFFYYSTVGAFMAYWGPYLIAREFSPAQVGIAFALMGLSRATVPLLWGWWADRSGRRMTTVRAAAFVSLLLFAMMPLMHGVRPVMAMMLAYTLFWNALLPQFEVVALKHLRGDVGVYTRVRLWGSVGFIVAVVMVGWLLDRTGILWEPLLVSVLFACMAALAWAVPDFVDVPVSRASQSGSLLPVLRRREVWVFLLACFCSQMSFAPYYNFFSIFLGLHGYSRSLAGQLWALGVAAEIALFMGVSRLVRSVGPRRLMLLALGSAALRWLALGLAVDMLWVLIPVQLLHALSFGAYHAVAMHYIQTLFPPDQQGRGQAAYNAASYGVGGSLGSLSAGYLWQATSPGFTFVAAGLVAALGGFLIWWGLGRGRTAMH